MTSKAAALPSHRVTPAIVAGHGDFAAGMVSAVEQIVGQTDLLIPLSNRSLSSAGIEQALRAIVDEHDVVVIFTDLPGGSATIAASRLVRDRKDLVLITGASLPMLLHYATTVMTSGADMARGAVERATLAMRTISGKGEKV